MNNPYNIRDHETDVYLERRKYNKNLESIVVTEDLIKESFRMNLLFKIMHSRLIHIILKHMRDIKGKKVLFIGGGVGREIVFIKNYCKEFYAINLDINLKNLSIGKAGFLPLSIQSAFILGDGMSLPLKTNSVDTVIFYNSIHHMDNTVTAIEEAMRVAKKICIVDRKKSLLSYIGRKTGIIQKEDGKFANEIDILSFKKKLRYESGWKLVSLKSHLLLLLYVNRNFNGWLIRHSLLSHLYIVLVKSINFLFGPLGNGVVIILENNSAL